MRWGFYVRAAVRFDAVWAVARLGPFSAAFPQNRVPCFLYSSERRIQGMLPGLRAVGLWNRFYKILGGRLMVAAAKPAHELSAWERFRKDVVRDKWLYLLLLPGMIFLIIFRYIPIFGNVIAFMDYNPYDTAASTWVGFDHFVDLLTRPQFLQVFGNTLYISILKMVCGFPIPIILALMMNEMKNLKFKKVSQTLLYCRTSFPGLFSPV